MRLTATVPATSANLGPGFDCFGLALDLCNEVALDTDVLQLEEVVVTGQGTGIQRRNLANAVSNELTRHFGDVVFRTLVPRNIRLAEAPSHGQSILNYDKGSRGAIAYMGLAGEVIRRTDTALKENA